MPTIQTSYGPATLRFGSYPRSGQTAVQLFLAGGELLATLSLNIPEKGNLLGEGEFFAKTYSENEEIAQACLASGRFEDTGKRVASGFVQVEIWKKK